ncbi:MAG: DUF4350 domain-containing protein [Pirellulales bacterium]
MRNALLLALVSILAAGCAKELDTVYGQRRGPGASKSVNGTAVLVEMFQQAGHKVRSARSLSPRLAEADTIVWFPDDFSPPSPDVRQWLEDWLWENSGRTLIYVGRDYDAAPGYWEKIQADAPAEQLPELRRRKAEADRDHLTRRPKPAAPEDCGWFTLDNRPARRKIRSLDGQDDWREGVDPTKLDIELAGRITPAKESEVLLGSKGDVLVSRISWGDSQLILVANGSFLLNLPLVNHEHRKLAGRLIAQVGSPGRVVFLESGASGPPIRDEDPSGGMRTGMEILGAWPANLILLHLAALGIIFCFSRSAIFGRPRQGEPAGVSDFGRHVAALGDLLARTGDSAFAVARLLNYRQTAGGESAPAARPGQKRFATRATFARPAGAMGASPSQDAPPSQHHDAERRATLGSAGASPSEDASPTSTEN